MALTQLEKAPRKGVYQKPKAKYVADPILDISAEKKQAILDVISEGQQLTLLGLLVEQIGDEIGLMTPEFIQAKGIYSQIRAILNG